MKFLVVGAGAIGSVFGGMLGRAGHDVLLVGRTPHMDVVGERGLRISGIWGSFVINNLTALTHLRGIANEHRNSIDAVLLTVKSYDTRQVMSELAGSFSDIPPVISLQNGIGNLEIVSSYVGAARAIGGRVIFGVEFVEPGHVRVTVEADRTVIGTAGDCGDAAFVNRLAEVFSSAGIATEATVAIERFIWGKLLYNCALNGLATLLKVTYGTLLACEGTRDIMMHLVEEVFSVARARGIPLDWKDHHVYTRVLFTELIPRTREHHPSMLQDILRGKPTEIDALNGAVEALGHEMGLALPYNEIIIRLVKAQEQLPQTI